MKNPYGFHVREAHRLMDDIKEDMEAMKKQNLSDADLMQFQIGGGAKRFNDSIEFRMRLANSHALVALALLAEAHLRVADAAASAEACGANESASAVTRDAPPMGEKPCQQ